MTYPLASTHMTEQKLHGIQAPAFRCFMAAMGFPHNTPKAVAYGPQEFGGIGARHLYTEQGISQIVAMLKHTRAQTTTGLLHKIELDHYQLSAGTSNNILQDTTPITYVDGAPLIQPMRKFMQDNRIHIELEQSWTVRPKREHDQHIMDIAQSQLTNAEQYSVNKCRIHLQVTLLSDVTDQCIRQTSILALCTGKCDFGLEL